MRLGALHAHASCCETRIASSKTLVDAAGVADLLAEWAAEDGRATRTTSLPARQVLTVWIALGLAQRPLTISGR